jgi:hypothetical protein
MTESNAEPTFLEWLQATIAAIDAMEEQEHSE